MKMRFKEILKEVNQEKIHEEMLHFPKITTQKNHFNYHTLKDKEGKLKK